MVNAEERFIYCDFCSKKVEKDKIEKEGWMFGQQGWVMYYGASGTVKFQTKQCCDEEVCKAKLLAWARS